MAGRTWSIGDRVAWGVHRGVVVAVHGLDSYGVRWDGNGLVGLHSGSSLRVDLDELIRESETRAPYDGGYTAYAGGESGIGGVWQSIDLAREAAQRVDPEFWSVWRLVRAKSATRTRYPGFGEVEVRSCGR